MKIIKLIILSITVVFVLVFLLWSFTLVFKNGFGPGSQDFEVKITDSCILHRNSLHIIYISCQGIEKNIDSKIIKLGWNNDYILAVTNPVTKRKYPNNPDNTYTIPDESVSYWWIIDVKNKKLYGPTSEEAYNSNKFDLSIPKDIVLTPFKDIAF